MKSHKNYFTGAFDFPTCELPKSEYAKVVSEINTNYRKYEGKGYCIHLSAGPDGNFYAYYFENHRFNEYNIYRKIKR